MAISLVNIGSFANGTTSLSVAYPGSISAGNMLLLVIVNKYPTNGPSTPSGGWALLAQKEGGSGSPGADSGNVYTTVYWKEADGTETGNVSVTITGGNSARGAILNFSKTTGTWALAASGGAVNTPTTSWSATTDAGIDLAPGDVLFAATGCYSDAIAGFGSHAFSASGVTFGTVSEHYEGATGSGDDIRTVGASGSVSSGSGSGAVTYTASLSNNQAGSTVVVRLREATSVAYTLDCDAGSFTLTGQDAGLTTQFKVDAAQGTFTLTGQDAALLWGYGIIAEVGTFTLTGNSVDFLAALTMAADAGSYTMTGQDAGLSAGYQVAADAGSFTLTGYDAEFLAALSVAAESGTFTLTGQDVTLTAALTLEAGAGVYTLTGNDVTLTFSGWSLLPGEGTWTNQTDTATWVVQASGGSWTVQDGTATWVIQPNSGSWTVQ